MEHIEEQEQEQVYRQELAHELVWWW